MNVLCLLSSMKGKGRQNMLEIKILQSRKELERTDKIYVGYQLWGTKNMPETYAHIGYVPDEGFYVKMVCQEKDPLRKYTNHMDPVCLDSAMEIFFQMPQFSDEYLNFEMNANGVMLTAHGPNRAKRTTFTLEQVEAMQCQAEMTEENWWVSYLIPESVLQSVYGDICLERGSQFLINFYKVCEGRIPGEFGSYTYIPLEHPSFHETEYFAEAVLV